MSEPLSSCCNAPIIVNDDEVCSKCFHPCAHSMPIEWNPESLAHIQSHRLRNEGGVIVCTQCRQGEEDCYLDDCSAANDPEVSSLEAK